MEKMFEVDYRFTIYEATGAAFGRLSYAPLVDQGHKSKIARKRKGLDSGNKAYLTNQK